MLNIRRRMMSANNKCKMTFSFNIPVNTEKTATFAFSYSTNQHLSIYWGDGSANTYDGRYMNATHTYSVESIARNVTVTIVGRVYQVSVSCGTLTNADITQNPYLEYINIRKAGLNSIDLSNSPKLHTLYLDGNNLTSIDISKLPALQLLYLAGQSGSNKITTLDISNNPKLTTLFCYMDTLTEIIGLDKIDRTINNFQITTSTHKLTSDFDLSKLRLSKFGLFTLATTGNITINASINRQRLFDANYNGSKSWGNWMLKANQIKVVFDDGYETTDYRDYAHHLATIVRDEALYKYPQCNSWGAAISGSGRDHYEDYLILKHDSYYGTTWANFEANSFGGASSMGVFTRRIKLPDAAYGKFKFKVTFHDDAKFFFGYSVLRSYGVMDSANSNDINKLGHPRFKYENGEFSCSGDMAVIATEVVDGYTETTLEVVLPKMNYWPTGTNNSASYTIGIYESSYSNESDPYVEKVKQLDLIE